MCARGALDACGRFADAPFRARASRALPRVDRSRRTIILLDPTLVVETTRGNSPPFDDDGNDGGDDDDGNDGGTDDDGDGADGGTDDDDDDDDDDDAGGTDDEYADDEYADDDGDDDAADDPSLDAPSPPAARVSASGGTRLPRAPSTSRSARPSR